MPTIVIQVGRKSKLDFCHDMGYAHTMIEKSSHYKKSYGAWAGNERGASPDYKRCCEQVREAGLSWPRYSQCSRPRGHGPDEAYCKQHDPAAVKAREDASSAKAELKWQARRYELHGRHFYDVLAEIAAGHNDARQLARDTIDTFNKRKW